MKRSLFILFLLLACTAFGAYPASPSRAIVIKLADGHDAAEVAGAFLEEGRTGLDGIDSILSGWAVNVVEPVIWQSDLEARDPDLFERMGMNRYLVIGWGPDDVQRPPYIINRMLSQLREQASVEEADRAYTLTASASAAE